MKITFKLFA